MRGKRGVELSVNFIVMLILGLAIFSVGIYIATQVFTKSYEQAKVLDSDIKFAIENDLRDTSEEVSIGLDRRRVNRGSNDVFGIGIANRDKNKQETTYILEVKFSVYDGEFNAGDKIIFPTLKSQSNEFNQITLKPNEVKILELPFTVPKETPSGTYVYNVRVLKKIDNTPVGKLQKIYVDVN